MNQRVLLVVLEDDDVVEDLKDEKGRKPSLGNHPYWEI
jgi:hypothetical protein